MFDAFIRRWKRPIHWQRGPKRGELQGSCFTDIYEHHTELRLPASIKGNPRGSFIPLRWHPGMVCLECGEMTMLLQVAEVREGTVKHFLAHISKDCYYEEQVEIVKVTYDEALDDVYECNIPDEYLAMHEKVLKKMVHRFDPTEVR